MLAVLVILLGVALEIVKANGWFIVPNVAIYIVFGIGMILVTVSVVSWIAAKKRFNRMSNSFIRR